MDGGGGHGISKLSVVAEKNSGLLLRVLTIGGTFFDPRSIFDPIMRGQRSNFRKIEFFLFYMRISQKLEIVAT